MGQIGGVSLDMAVDDEMLFLGQGPRILVLDVSDPARPVETGRSEVLPGIVTAIDVAGPVAVAGVGPAVVVVDVSEPAAPTVVAEIDGLSGPVQAVVVTDSDGGGRHAYVASGHLVGSTKLTAIDTGSSGPHIVADLELPGHVTGLVLDGTLLHALAGGEPSPPEFAGVWTLDVTVPSDPTGVGSPPSPQAALGLAARAGYLYTTETDRFTVYDASDPHSPMNVGTMALGEPGGAVRVSDGRAVVVAGGALRVVDVSDPTRPLQVGFTTAQKYPRDLEIAGGFAYLLESSGADASHVPTLRIIDLSDEANPVDAGSVRLPSSYSAVVVSDGLAFVGADGLRVIDVSVPSEPRLTGAHAIDGQVQSLALADDRAYLYSNGLHIVDIADPFQPRELSTLSDYRSGPRSTSSIGGPSGFIAPEGRRAVVTNGYRLYDIDVSHPDSPTVAAELPPLPGYPGPGQDLAHAGGVGVVNGMAVVTHGPSMDRHLSVVDFTGPDGPRAVAQLEGPERGAYAVTVRDDVAYIGLNGAGLWTVDLSDPRKPTPLGLLPAGGSIRTASVGVAGDRAYLTLMPYVDLSPAYGRGGVREFDITDPAAPTEVGVYRTLGYPMGVFVRDGLAYVADGPAGLLILDVRSGD